VNDGYRIAAVAAAAALLAAPHWSRIAAVSRRALEAAVAKAGLIARVAAAALLIAAAWGKVPLPNFSAPAVTAVEVETPSEQMKQVVAPIAAAMKDANAVDRALWAQVWTKAAVVVAGDAVASEVVFTDTKSLRAFTVIAIDIAWRRIGQNQPGKYVGLREATEAAFASVIGMNEVPVTKDVRTRYAELCKAIAWAGVGKG
jgi:hypothetical protein